MNSITTLSILFLSFITVASQGAISPALPEIKSAIGGEARFEWMIPLILTIPALAVAIFSPIAGIISDRMRSKTPLIAALVIYAILGSVGIFSSSPIAILMGRFMLGIAVSFIWVRATAMSSQGRSGNELYRLMGLQSATLKCGGVASILFGGYLSAISWRAPFAFPAIAGIIGIILTLIVPQELFHPTATQNINIRKDRIQPRMAMTLSIIAFLGVAIFYIIPSRLPFILSGSFQMAPATRGHLIALTVASAGAGSYLYHRIVPLLGTQRIPALTFLLIGSGLLLISSAKVIFIIPALIISGFGFGLHMPNLNSWVSEIAPSGGRGLLWGVCMSAMALGQFCSPLISSTLIKDGALSSLFEIFNSFGLWTLALAAVTAITPIHRHKTP